MWDAAKRGVKKEFLGINAYLKKKKGSTIHLEEIEETKPKVSRRKNRLSRNRD